MIYTHLQYFSSNYEYLGELIVADSRNELGNVWRFKFSKGGIVFDATFNGQKKDRLVFENINKTFVYKIIAGEGVTPKDYAYCNIKDNTPLTDDNLIEIFIKK